MVPSTCRPLHRQSIGGLQKAPGIVGRAAEGEAQRVARLFDMLADFGEGELVVG